jgi:hypothetical protein
MRQRHTITAPDRAHEYQQYVDLGSEVGEVSIGTRDRRGMKLLMRHPCTVNAHRSHNGGESSIYNGFRMLAS